MNQERSPAPDPDPSASLTDLWSAGRVSLGWAMTHYCLMHWGTEGPEVDKALSGSGERWIAGGVRGAAATLGRAFAVGAART